MASPRANPALIGAFVVGAFALAVVAVVVFGSGRMFEERSHFVSYFEDPVTGLDVGAPVILHGVKLGEVTRIEAMIRSGTFEILVRVHFEVVEGAVETIGERVYDGSDTVMMFIEHGLRAQLKSQSLITGKLYLDLARHPDTEIVLYGLDPGLHEIPSIPSPLQLLGREMRSLVDRIAALPLEKLVDGLASAAEGLDKLVNDPEAAEAIERLSGALGRAESLLAKLDERSDGLVDELEASVRELRETAGAAGQTLTAVQASVEPGSLLHEQLLETLTELQSTLRSLRTLADQVSEQPEQVIFGRPQEEGAE